MQKFTGALCLTIFQMFSSLKLQFNDVNRLDSSQAMAVIATMCQPHWQCWNRLRDCNRRSQAGP
eukprot:scaffold139036_cov17-Prasinocladus_malaysianus.AAC.1